MPKYWVKNYFAHGSFPEVGQKQKTKGKKEKKKRRERLNDGDNNGQARGRSFLMGTNGLWVGTSLMGING